MSKIYFVGASGGRSIHHQSVRPVSTSYLPRDDPILRGSSTGILSAATAADVRSSFPISSSGLSHPRSNFLLGPTKSVIFAANNNADNMQVNNNNDQL
jgi:hypothetical protein